MVKNDNGSAIGISPEGAVDHHALGGMVDCLKSSLLDLLLLNVQVQNFLFK